MDNGQTDETRLDNAPVGENTTTLDMWRYRAILAEQRLEDISTQAYTTLGYPGGLKMHMQPLSERLRAMAFLMHAAGTWGFVAEGKWLEDAADIVEAQEKKRATALDELAQLSVDDILP